MTEELELNSQQGKEIFLSSTAFRLAVELTKPPRQSILTAVSLEVKWQGHETDYSPPPNAICISPPLYIFRA
jgi:hypothetical protein